MKKKKQILEVLAEYQDKLNEFYTTQKRMPSYQEAARLFGMKSKDSAYKAIQKLVAMNVVAKDTQGKLIPSTFVSFDIQESKTIRLLGLVEAGFAAPAEQDVLDTVSLDEWLIGNRDASFMLRVKGDSMYDAGIRDGDMVIVERTHDAKVGQIVIAEVDGEWTMKYLRQDINGMYLEPANETYKPIRPTERLEIAAVVRAVVRKYVS
jgi:SOS regulatory protein LexA